MLKFRDFAPPVEELGLLGERSLTSFEHAVENANNWITAFHVDVVNVETVVLPNIPDPASTVGAELPTSDENFWYQIVRVWYREVVDDPHTDEIKVFGVDDEDA